VLGTRAVIRDVTERKRAEQEIHAKNEKLSTQNEELRAAEEELRNTNEELQSANEELRETQEQLVRSEKLAAIGQLAGGVGHELRNPLGALKNAAYYIRGKLAKNRLAKEETRVMEFLDIMDEEIAISSKILNDLLNFSRTGKPAVSATRIEPLIDSTLSRLAIPDDIAVTKKLEADLPQVEIDPDQIRQVLVNLITNAVQAMPEGGRLTVSARGRGKALEVTITDTGTGIPQKVVSKIFDPLFTTKAKGIGLGLAVTKSIIENHKGSIGVSSKVGRGTTFTIELPLNTAKAKGE
jgi:signal transduction histidine kinase